MSNLTIVRGLPGTGKSTFAKMLDAILVEADDFFMVDGIYTFDGRRLREAHQYCFDKTKELLKAGKDVVVANTFSTIMELRPYLYLGYHTTIYKMCRIFTNIHEVPEATIQKYIRVWENYAGEIEVKSG